MVDGCSERDGLEFDFSKSSGHMFLLGCGYMSPKKWWELFGDQLQYEIYSAFRPLHLVAKRFMSFHHQQYIH